MHSAAYLSVYPELLNRHTDLHFHRFTKIALKTPKICYSGSNCIGHILRRNCLLKHIIEGETEGRVEMRGRQERRRKHLLEDLKERRKTERGN